MMILISTGDVAVLSPFNTKHTYRYVCVWQVIREQPSHDVLVTTLIYRADDFGRVKMEHYVQTRLADGKITLDYSEHYETHPERVTHRNVIDAHPEVAAAEAQPPQVVETSSVKEETDEPSEHSDGQTDADEEEALSEEEKKGLCLLSGGNLAYCWY